MSGPTPSLAPPPARAAHPYIGMVGVLLGAVISTLSGRLTTFGLADVRGAIGAGLDEGAWITTAATVGQMVVAFPAVWLGAAFGPRRVLLWAAGVFAVSQSLLPLSPELFGGLPGVRVWQAVGGLAGGTFIPMTIGFVLRNLPASLATHGVAAYGMNSELSQNIAATLEDCFVNHFSWRWIFWDTALVAPAMMLCVWLGVPRERLNRALLEKADGWGMLFASAGFGLLYAGLDRGNRLDWAGSGPVTGLLAGGAVLVAAFVMHEPVSPRPAISLRFLVHGNIPLLGSMLVLFRLMVLSTAYLPDRSARGCRVGVDGRAVGGLGRGRAGPRRGPRKRAGPGGWAVGTGGGDPGRRAGLRRRLLPAGLGGGGLPLADAVAARAACPARSDAADPRQSRHRRLTDHPATSSPGELPCFPSPPAAASVIEQWMPNHGRCVGQ